MLAAGLNPIGLTALVITHEHPDHVSGFPLFVEKMWLLGRRAPIPVVGPEPALDVARRLFETFDTSGWDGLPPLDWRPVAFEAGARAWQDETLTITTSPVVHPVPTIGLRVEATDGAVVAYSCDTSPTGAVTDLARGADVLVHEATGYQPGVHSSAEEAAEAARSADAGRLLLVHLPPGLDDDDLADARQIFPRTDLGEEGGRYAVSA
jgi:ribonuclease Z